MYISSLIGERSVSTTNPEEGNIPFSDKISVVGSNVL